MSECLQIFVDLGEKYLIRSENVKRGQLLGRGAFGFVFKGSCRTCAGNSYVDVAMKMLQPVQPGPNARQSAIIAYKVSCSFFNGQACSAGMSLVAKVRKRSVKKIDGQET